MPPLHITLVGLGSIGISFAALYLAHSNAVIKVYDPRPDLGDHIQAFLPDCLRALSFSTSVDQLIAQGRLLICASLSDACHEADIVQEQGPENIEAKTATWLSVIQEVRHDTRLWTATSGITASEQVKHLSDKHRLLVVHPFNPPHLMPLIELVPSPQTAEEQVEFAKSFFANLGSGHNSVVLRKELPGFVGNRLAFVLLREAFHLVTEGVVDVADLDTIVESSIGPRWASMGPFKSYNLGGGPGGMPHFMTNLSGTMQSIWDDAGALSLRDTVFLSGADSKGSPTASSAATTDWAEKIAQATLRKYGPPTPAMLAERDADLQRILRARQHIDVNDCPKEC